MKMHRIPKAGSGLDARVQGRKARATFREVRAEALALAYVLQERRTDLTPAILISELGRELGETNDGCIARSVDALATQGLVRFVGPYIRPARIFDGNGEEVASDGPVFPPQR